MKLISLFVSLLVSSLVWGKSLLLKWDAEDVSCGIYFYRLRAGEFTKSGKVLHLR